MKRIINKFIIGLLFVGGFASCDGLLDINDDPNAVAPDAVRIEEALTSGLVYLSDFQRLYSTQESFIWSQYWTWGPGVALGPADRNEYAATSSNAIWSRAYAGILTDMKFIIEAEDNEPVYTAIAQIVSAYVYGGLVDMFGDIPYSEALNGEFDDGANWSPAIESGAAIYADLVTTLDGAIAALEGVTVDDAVPGANDVIFQGDIDSWLRVAHSLKLKLLVRQTVNGGPADLGTQIGNAIANGTFIESNSENMQLEWSGGVGDVYPLYAEMESGLGLFYVLSETTQDFLENVVPGGDPRLDAFYDTPTNGGGHAGIPQGDVIAAGGQPADWSLPSGLIYGPDVNSVFMSAAEVWFYRAEAAIRGFSAESATTTFSNAVTANFDQYGVSGASAYLTALDFGNAADQLDVLAYQMWIAFNGSQSAEGWHTTRKFDNSSNPLFATDAIFVSPTDNSLGVNVFPSIWLYPQTEVDGNANLTGEMQHELTDKVFWDN